MSERKENRQQQILRELAEIPTLQIEDMARTHDVSTETTRRDFDELTRRDVLNRTYGGTVRVMNSGPTVTEHHQLFTEERERIVRDAVHCMYEGRIFMIGSGATTIYVARRMASKLRSITVITHAFDVVTVLSMNPTIRVIITPGKYCATEEVMTGAQVLRFLNQLTMDYTLLGVSSVAAGRPGGVSIDSRAIYRAMIQCAVKSIVITNYSKFDLAYPYHYVD